METGRRPTGEGPCPGTLLARCDADWCEARLRRSSPAVKRLPRMERAVTRGIAPSPSRAVLRVLIAAYYFPPAPVNSARWVTMSRYLQELGVDATVLTTGAFGSADVDRELKVVRTRDAARSPLLRRLLRRGKAPTEGGVGLI